MARDENCEFNVLWGDRAETVDDCARRAAKCFEGLLGCHPSLERWAILNYKTGARKFEPRVDSLRALLVSGASERDSSGMIVERWGYRTVIWNGVPGEGAAGVHIRCGACLGVTNIPVPNSCGVSFPQGTEALQLMRRDKLEQIARAVVESWDPDWGRFASGELFQQLSGDSSEIQMVGWVTYFSGRYGELPKLPAEFEVSRLGDGTLVRIKAEPPWTSSNPEHVEPVRRLITILGEAGKLVPTPPVT